MSPSLVGEVFLGASGCEHESYSADAEIIHGPDEGMVTIKVGDACITLSSSQELIERLERRARVPVSVAG